MCTVPMKFMGVMEMLLIEEVLRLGDLILRSWFPRWLP